MEVQSGDDEEQGEWLHVRVRHGRISTPVRVSRKALEDQFGAFGGGRSLAFLYARNADAIDGAVRAKMKTGGPYTPEHPLELRASDLSSLTGIERGTAGRPSQMTDADLQRALEEVVSAGHRGAPGSGNHVRWISAARRVGLAGSFSVDQLELIALRIRQALDQGARPATGEVVDPSPAKRG
ncbi:hypothetical protein RT97_04940 [Variovorax paradoxus]|uniref:Uncharacterized protein n=1 Tax=Variovorax paradoxus TaxID=34073 RepID=A0A0D0N1M3_VARPD|nr:hypothetical protein [Variovorax paradoxus]KIQ35260.1 hypothetical protein RT97_04940 [Variovorax paradoxus]